MRARRAWIGLALALGACGGDGAPAGNHILDNGHGEPNRAPLEPLRPGTVFDRSISQEIVDAPVSEGGRRLIRVREINEYGTINSAELTFDDGDLLLVGNSTNGRLKNPMMTVPGTVRDGMKWEADPDGKNGADYRFTVADLGMVDSSFGPQHRWTITIDEYGSGAQSVRTYAEDFGFVGVGDALEPFGVFPLEDGEPLDAPDVGPTIPLVFVADDRAGSGSAASYGNATFITFADGTTMAGIHYVPPAFATEGTIGGCMALPEMRGDLFTEVSVSVVSSAGGPVPMGWNAITGAGQCPMTNSCDVSDVCFNDTMASAGAAFVRGAEVYWRPPSRDVLNYDLGLTRTGQVGGDGVGSIASTISVLGVDASGAADVLVVGGLDGGGMPTLLRGSHTSLYDAAPSLATRLDDPWRSMPPTALTFLDPGATGDATLIFTEPLGSLYAARFEDGVAHPGVRQPWRLPSPSLHASDGGALDALQIGPEGQVEEIVVDASGVSVRTLGRLALTPGDVALNGYRQGDQIFVFTFSFDEAAGQISALHLYRGQLPATAGAPVHPIPAAAVSSIEVGIHGEAVAVCWPGSGTLSIDDVTIGGAAPTQVVNYDNGGPCALIIRDISVELGSVPVVIARLPGIGRVAVRGGARPITGGSIGGTVVAEPSAWLSSGRIAGLTGVGDPTGTVIEAPVTATFSQFVSQSIDADLAGAGAWMWRTVFEDNQNINELVLIGDQPLQLRDAQLGDPGSLTPIVGGGVLLVGPAGWHRVSATGEISAFTPAPAQLQILAVLADGTVIGPMQNGAGIDWVKARDGQVLLQVPAVVHSSGLMPGVALPLPDGSLVLTSEQYGLPVTRLDLTTLTTTELHDQTLHLRQAPDGTIWGWERGWDNFDPITTFGSLDASGYHPIPLPSQWTGTVFSAVVGDGWFRFGDLFLARP